MTRRNYDKDGTLHQLVDTRRHDAIQGNRQKITEQFDAYTVLDSLRQMVNSPWAKTLATSVD